MLTSLLLITKRKFKLWTFGTLFTIASFGLVLKSGFNSGWLVYYGPVVKYLMFTQVFIVLFSFWLFSGNKLKNFSLLVILSFGLDYLVSIARYSYFSGSYYAGIALDALRFVGLKYTLPFSLEFVNSDFSAVISSSLLRFDFQRIWNSTTLSLVFYPLAHVFIGYVLLYLLKHFSSRVRKIVLIILAILFALYLRDIIYADPRIVVKN